MPRSNKSRSLKHTKKTGRKRGGGCGCGAVAHNSFFMGGKSRRNNVRGGAFTNTLLHLPSQHYYPLNNYNLDPNHQVVDARLVGNIKVGGKGTRRIRMDKNKTRSNRRRVKGGNVMGSAISFLQTGTSLTIPGANDYNLNQNFFQPTNTMYTNMNPPTRMA